MDLYVTNNPYVLENVNIRGIVRAEGFMDALTKARDLVHKGHALRSHPLSGSVKPGETPYKTIALSQTAGELDLDSLRIIEECIVMARKYCESERTYSEAALRDFQLVDYSLVFGRTRPKAGISD